VFFVNWFGALLVGFGIRHRLWILDFVIFLNPLFCFEVTSFFFDRFQQKTAFFWAFVDTKAHARKG
jgi:hypothetical protein